MWHINNYLNIVINVIKLETTTVIVLINECLGLKVMVFNATFK